MVVLIIAVYACIELRLYYPKESEMRSVLKAWHFSLGLSIFLLAWFRLTLRWTQVSPRIEPELSRRKHYLSKTMHSALYIFMLGMPFIGWMIFSANGKSAPFFSFDWPALIGANKQNAKLIKQIHEYGGTAGYYLIGAHATAALLHHYVRRDNTLLRMLPIKWTSSTQQPNEPPIREKHE